ncbi:MAG: hypothetical protein IJI36_13610 [Kiritimatiellae bacterium]|nr:hypothetical protein [Kiritimatiellia bacterium]
MKKLAILVLCAYASLSAAFAGAPARRKLTVTVDWAQGNEESRIALAFLKKTVLGYRDAGYVIAMKATLRDGGNVPEIHVTDASGKEVYAGSDKNDAAVALTEAIMNQPVPGQMITGVELKKFRGADKRYVMGKMKGEGTALAPFKTALKSKKPAEAEEAQAILDSIERAKKNLEEDIEACLAEDSKDAKGEALRDIRWFRATWPSEAKKYDESFKRLSADPEAKAAEAALLKPKKRR